MTAEITMLNRSAIVLAADSAVTISDSQSQIVHHSANKLFMLSKYHPVGLMIYQNTDFMGIPWETIIKLYRKKLGRKEFSQLIDYLEDFKVFLSENRALFPEDLQKINFKELAKGRLIYLREKVRQEFKKESEVRMQANNALTAEEIKQIFTKVIEGEWLIQQNAQVLPSFSSSDKDLLIQKYEDTFIELIRSEFQESPLDTNLQNKLREFVIYYFIRNWFVNYSGVVIAGFGKDEVFPSYVHCWVELIFENRLKYYEYPCKTAMNQTLEFFAQSDKGTAFVTGMDPDLFNHSEKKFSEFKQKLETTIEENILTYIVAEKRVEAKNNLQGLINTAAKEYNESIQNFIRDCKVAPIFRTIGNLSKDELASAAESLVNLTSFKKRVSGELETVGGPIDVAVISKGDGFIWIKRKHYFDPKLNQHFLKNYYLGDENEE